MKCEKCKQNEATFFYEETVNGKKRSFRLCEDCAKALQQSGEINVEWENPFGSFFSPVAYPDLLGNLFDVPQIGGRRETRKKCPGCGATWEDLAAAGKVFCPECYKTFADELENTVRSVHGNVTHTGRAPAGVRAGHEKADRLAALRKELKEAVEAENFEKAAELRDSIRAEEGKE